MFAIACLAVTLPAAKSPSQTATVLPSCASVASAVRFLGRGRGLAAISACGASPSHSWATWKRGLSATSRSGGSTRLLHSSHCSALAGYLARRRTASRRNALRRPAASWASAACLASSFLQSAAAWMLLNTALARPSTLNVSASCSQPFCSASDSTMALRMGIGSATRFSVHLAFFSSSTGTPCRSATTCMQLVTSGSSLASCRAAAPCRASHETATTRSTRLQAPASSTRPASSSAVHSCCSRRMPSVASSWETCGRVG
mmetsp:Transcript_13704/g.54229  ORF Transcript_13704/g.54229 Transcript_13704/m.54229 type:complete len:260 (+) Transcript_13704:1530-2309(+)